MLHFLGGVGLGGALEAICGQMDVLEVIQVLKDRLAGIESLGAAGQFGESRQAAFDFGVESDG